MDGTRSASSPDRDRSVLVAQEADDLIQLVRSKAAADYSIKWIDLLESMARQWPGWRSEKEKSHVFAQFEEARTVYRRRAVEAGAAPSQEPRN
jgi:hypothetical protein